MARLTKFCHWWHIGQQSDLRPGIVRSSSLPLAPIQETAKDTYRTSSFVVRRGSKGTGDACDDGEVGWRARCNSRSACMRNSRKYDRKDDDHERERTASNVS